MKSTTAILWQISPRRISSFCAFLFVLLRGSIISCSGSRTINNNNNNNNNNKNSHYDNKNNNNNNNNIITNELAHVDSYSDVKSWSGNVPMLRNQRRFQSSSNGVDPVKENAANHFSILQNDKEIRELASDMEQSSIESPFHRGKSGPSVSLLDETIRINCGATGPMITPGTSNVEWNKDQYCTEGSTFNACAKFPSAPTLYCTGRKGEVIQYDIPGLERGLEYNVTLYFMELYWQKFYQRVADIYIENSLVLQTMDYFEQFGYQQAGSISTLVKLNDKKLTIRIQQTNRDVIKKRPIRDFLKQSRIGHFINDRTQFVDDSNIKSKISILNAIEITKINGSTQSLSPSPTSPNISSDNPSDYGSDAPTTLLPNEPSLSPISQNMNQQPITVPTSINPIDALLRTNTKFSTFSTASTTNKLSNDENLSELSSYMMDLEPVLETTKESVMTQTGSDVVTTFPLYINSGYMSGNLVDLSTGNQWLSDNYYTRVPFTLAKTETGCDDKNYNNNTLVYCTYRIGNDIDYKIPVPSGLYQVTLLFMEPYYGSPGMRPMKISLQDGLVSVNDYDPFTEAGGIRKPTMLTMQAVPVRAVNPLMQNEHEGHGPSSVDAGNGVESILSIRIYDNEPNRKCVVSGVIVERMDVGGM